MALRLARLQYSYEGVLLEPHKWSGTFWDTTLQEWTYRDVSTIDIGTANSVQLEFASAYPGDFFEWTIAAPPAK